MSDPGKVHLAPDDTLDLIPRVVRDKLDRVGIKLHLREWQALPLSERTRLRDLRCDSEVAERAYAAVITELVVRFTGKPPQAL